ncbi:MAG: PQQ-like beta-propeller repeat protein [Planctomycetes bacterium]|nr:PQQ-like beta-propeller repeat protein [Planctomycetota bacterium]
MRGEFAVVLSHPHVGTFWAISLKDHKVLWAHNTENVTGMWPALDGQHVYVGCNSGRFSAYDLATGKELWTFAPPLMNSMVPSPVVYGNRVYLAGHNRHLYCLDTQSGKVLWSFDTGDYPYGSPALAGGLVFFASGSNRGRLFALRAGASGPASWPLWRGSPSCNGAVEPAAPKP